MDLSIQGIILIVSAEHVDSVYGGGRNHPDVLDASLIHLPLGDHFSVRMHLSQTRESNDRPEPGPTVDLTDCHIDLEGRFTSRVGSRIVNVVFPIRILSGTVTPGRVVINHNSKTKCFR